jgi:hypothetical protein
MLILYAGDVASFLSEPMLHQ